MEATTRRVSTRIILTVTAGLLCSLLVSCTEGSGSSTSTGMLPGQVPQGTGNKAAPAAAKGGPKEIPESPPPPPLPAEPPAPPAEPPAPEPPAPEPEAAAEPAPELPPPTPPTPPPAVPPAPLEPELPSPPAPEEGSDASDGTSGGIANLQVVMLSPRSAEVVWETADFQSSQVLWGAAADLSDAATAEGRVDRYHNVLLTNLEAGKTYYYKVLSSAVPSSSESAMGSFTVPLLHAPVVRETHPRIFFSQEDLPVLKQKILGSHARYWKLLNSYCASALATDSQALASDPNSNLFVKAFAFAGLLGGDPGYVRKAEDLALTSARLSLNDTMSIRRSVQIMSCVYDWLHPQLCEATRSTLRAAILYRMSCLPTNDRDFIWGWNPEIFSPLTLGALALYGEVPEAKGYLEDCVFQYRHRILAPWRHFARDGGTIEGWWYSAFHVDFFLDAVLSLRSATNVDFLESETWLNDLVDWFCLGLRGDSSFHRLGDAKIFQGLHFSNRRFAACMASVFHNGRAQWLAQKIEATIGIWGPTAVNDILLYDPGIQPCAPTGRADRFFPEAGVMLAAEAWGPDAVQVAFRSGRDFTLGHTHRDNNSFAIFYRAGQALDSGVYDEYTSAHHMNYYERSVAHNTVLVFDPTETFRRYSQVFANDGGQQYLRSPEQVPYVCPGIVEDLLDPNRGYQAGGIYFFESTDRYAYAVGDAAPSYSGGKLTAFDRHFLFLRQVAGFAKPVTVVYDYVVTTDGAYRKTYLLHTQNEPVVSGTLVSSTNGAGMLYQQTLLPASPRIEVIGGPGKEFWVNGANYPPIKPPQALEEAGRFRVEVSPSTCSLEDRFLHLLYATDAGSGPPLQGTAVDAGTMKGLSVGDWVVLFPAGVSAVEGAAYAVEAGSRTHLLAGLVPLAPYRVLLGGMVLGELRASKEGTLSFETEIGAEVAVTLNR